MFVNMFSKPLLLLLLFSIAAPSVAQDFSFVSIRGLIEQDVGRKVMPKVYEKLGLSIDIEPMPGQRAQKEATSGNKDGEIMRIWTYGEENNTVVRVPTPYYQLETMGFILSNRTDIVVNSKEDLAKYKLVKVRGVKHTNNISAGMPFVHDIKNTSNMMEFLTRGRADIALTNTVDGELALKKMRITNVKKLGPPLAVLDLFNYIHESKADIVPEVDAAIKEMQANGELAEVIKVAEEEVIEQIISEQ